MLKVGKPKTTMAEDMPCFLSKQTYDKHVKADRSLTYVFRNTGSVESGKVPKPESAKQIESIQSASRSVSSIFKNSTAKDMIRSSRLCMNS